MADEIGHELIDEIADDFLTRCLRNTEPDIEEYCTAYPWLEKEIRQLLPMLKFLESSKEGPGTTRIPNSIGRYKILKEIGRGAMGIVFEARHPVSKQRVAIKMLQVDGVGSTDALTISRFEREARVVGSFNHPGVVKLIESGEENGIRYLIMQLIEGSSLDKIIRLLECARRSKSNGWFQAVMRHVSQGRVSPPDSDYFAWIAGLGARTASALQVAHQNGILHRDVKPSNVLVDESGRSWLTDFGLAKTEDAKLTRTGQVIGTLRYLAPERMQGDCDHLADVYGLGLTLYELLVQRPAFPAADRIQLIAAIDRGQPDWPRQVDSSIPQDLEKIVMDAIAKDKTERTQSAGEMAKQLGSWLESNTGSVFGKLSSRI